jgi:hypothetical protein
MGGEILQKPETWLQWTEQVPASLSSVSRFLRLKSDGRRSLRK